MPTPRTGWTHIFARRLDKSGDEFMILHEGLKDAHIPWPVAELVLENQFPHPSQIRHLWLKPSRRRSTHVDGHSPLSYSAHSALDADAAMAALGSDRVKLLLSSTTQHTAVAGTV